MARPVLILALLGACTGQISGTGDPTDGSVGVPDGPASPVDAPAPPPPDAPLPPPPDAPPPPPPDAGVPFTLSDSLRGSTLGNPVGGSFSPDGWTVTAANDRLWYIIPRLVEGSVEFTISNATLGNLLLNDNEIFAMYDGGYDITEPVNYNPEYRNNNFKSMIRIYGVAEVGREGLQKLMWNICPDGPPGYGDGTPCVCPTNFFSEPYGGDPTWDGTPQRFRVEWGGGVTRLYRNGAEVHAIDWSGTGLQFGPNELHFSLGTSRADAVGTAGMPIGAVFSDLVVQGMTGGEASCPP